MTNPPPLIRDQSQTDSDHLRLLAIFHFVIAGFAVLGIGFLCVHFAIMQTVFANPEIWKDAKGGPPPAGFFAIFQWFYLAGAVFFVALGIANLLSGVFIRGRKNRMFSLVIAGIDCLQFPFGTALGVFTFLILTRDSVRKLYEARELGLPVRLH